MSDGVGKCFGCKNTTKIAALRGEHKNFFYKLFPKYKNTIINLCRQCYIAVNNKMYKKVSENNQNSDQCSKISTTTTSSVSSLLESTNSLSQVFCNSSSSSVLNSDSSNVRPKTIAIDDPINRNVNVPAPIEYHSSQTSSETDVTVRSTKTVRKTGKPAPACIKKRRIEQKKAQEVEAEQEKEQEQMPINYVSSDEESDSVNSGVRLPHIQPIIRRRRIPDPIVPGSYEDYDAPIFNTRLITGG